MSNRSNAPVWTVYDKLRSSRLTVKYYNQRLALLERQSFFIEFFLAATAPTSAIAALFFWQTSLGEIIWKVFGVAAAILSVLKPILGMNRRIKDVETILTGYRGIEFDLCELKDQIEQNQQFGKEEKAVYDRIVKREKEFAIKPPETRIDENLKVKCQDEVNRELPANAFFVPA